MGKRPLEKCRLCREGRLLCDSHLIPAATFRALRAEELPNPNPVIVGERNAFTSSKQVSDYLLCELCEGRFRRNGEDWVLANLWKPDGSFPLREKVFMCTPEVSHEGFVAYRGAEVPGISCEHLVYFGMSVFWRAAVHFWRWQGGHIHIDLGPYLDPIQPFLLGEQGFPEKMSLVVRVSGLKEELLGMTLLPTSERRDGYHMHSFTVPGMTFLLAVGSCIPPVLMKLSTAPAALTYLVFNAPGQWEELIKMVTAVRSVKPPKGYERV